MNLASWMNGRALLRVIHAENNNNNNRRQLIIAIIKDMTVEYSGGPWYMRGLMAGTPGGNIIVIISFDAHHHRRQRTKQGIQTSTKEDTTYEY